LNNRAVKEEKPLPVEITKIDSVEVFKSKREMVIFSNGNKLKTYNISLGTEPEGPKQFEGDKKTPEGKYIFDRKNTATGYHLSIHISYPNEQDKIKAASFGKAPGSDIMLHGIPNNADLIESYYENNDWTHGCIAVNNNDMDELWRVIDVGTPVIIYP